MKHLKTIITGILVLTLSIGYAQQKNPGKLNTTTKKTFTWNANDGQIKYNVIVYEKRDYEMKWDKEDKGKVDQDRTSSLAKVTKLIRLESDHDFINDRFLVLKYDRQVTDTFKVSPIPNGFQVTVDGKVMKYVFDEGKYYVDTADKDFFVVEEFGAK